MIKKEPVKKEVAKKPAAVQLKHPMAERYFQATGGRKSARALVRVFGSKGDIIINGKKYGDYFKTERNKMVARAAMEAVSAIDNLSAEVRVQGGGLNAQADAIRNGMAKALVALNAAFKPALRRLGYLTRDSRVVERKKYGLKKARKAPQWAKR